MTWNYRIIDHGDWRALCEVYYDEEDGCPLAFTERPVGFIEHDGEDGGIQDSLVMSLRDIGRYPPLHVSIFSLPREERPRIPRMAKEDKDGMATD